MTDRHLKRLLTASHALQSIMPWVDQLIRAEVRRAFPSKGNGNITVRHSDGRRQICKPPRVDRNSWTPPAHDGPQWVSPERCK